MKIKKQFKDWRKLSKHEKREILSYCEAYDKKHKNHSEHYGDHENESEEDDE